MKILMLLDGPYEGDFRLKKEVSTLLENGHEITLVCYRTGDKPKESIEGALKLLRTEKVIDNRRAGFIDILNSVFFINFDISKRLSGLHESFDVVHVHDLPLANTGLRYARKKQIPCVLDLHENYPEALKIWFSWRKNPLIRIKNKVFFGYSKWFSRERRMTQKYDFVVAVVEEMKERIVELHKLDSSKVYVVSNTEPKDLFLPVKGEKSSSDRFQILYVGGIGPHRGLQTAIAAMPEIVKKHAHAEMVIIGSGNTDTMNYLRNLVSKLKMEEHVNFTGRLPFKEALEYMKGAGINMIPHLKNNHTDHTIPHKLFQIMNSEFLLLVSSCKPLKRIVEEYDAGLVFEADNPRDFADQVDFAINNPEKVLAKAKNAHKAVQGEGLNWEADAKRLVALYDDIASL
ncbi:MAG: glycosyltransferase family 4 protein [Flavobacteriales bacterium]|nr:glycosyltransferase family 4 protein [Flavobacteriales bacterium]